jgi:hypothetical protein
MGAALRAAAAALQSATSKYPYAADIKKGTAATTAATPRRV